jgi:hypothetical protein
MGEWWLWRFTAGERLDPETGRGSGEKDQREDDPGHSWLLPSS